MIAPEYAGELERFIAENLFACLLMVFVAVVGLVQLVTWLMERRR